MSKHMFKRLSVFLLILLINLPADAEDWAHHRYMEQTQCKILDADSSLLKDFPIIRPYLDAANKGGTSIKSCTYSFDQRPGVTQYGWVVLADPPSKVLDAWVKTACEQGAPQRTRQCVDALTSYIRGQSGGQFPIVGFVSEGGPTDELCKQHGKPVPVEGLISFQDGVTIQRAASSEIETGQTAIREGIYCSTDGWGEDVQKLISAQYPISEIYAKSRLSGLDKSCGTFITAALIEEAKAQNLDVKFAWLLASRHNYVHALETGVDAMMIEQARRFNRGENIEDVCKKSQ